jgi:hypothetical protein
VIWLGEKRGYLSDWITQLWVRATGRRVSLADAPWLSGPVGNTRHIGKDFFDRYARDHHLDMVRTGSPGLLHNFADLEIEPTSINESVRDFYEHTSLYEMDAWSEWQGLFKPFGVALAWIFSRRLQQLNVPLSAMDTSRGITSEVIRMRDRESGRPVETAWIRQLVASGNVIYAGSYSVCRVPGYSRPCVKVVFPLPNGSAMVIMRPEFDAHGVFSVVSDGNAFGDPGFYFVVHRGGGAVRARYVRSMKETIRVDGSRAGELRADHLLKIWGAEFLRIHYRLRKVGAESSAAAIHEPALGRQ